MSWWIKPIWVQIKAKLLGFLGTFNVSFHTEIILNNTPRSHALETDRMGISETVIDSDDGNLSRGLTCTTS